MNKLKMQNYYDTMNVTECFCKNSSEFYPEHRLKIINVIIIKMRLLKILLNLIKIVMGYLIIILQI